MNMFAILQALIIGVVVVFSIWQAFRKLMPKTGKRVQARVSAALDQPARSPGLRKLGRWLQPDEAKAGGCGSGDGCSSCGSCASAAPAPASKSSVPAVKAMPLEFRPRRH